MKKIDKTTAWILFLLTGWSYGQFKEYPSQIFYYVMVFIFMYFSVVLSPIVMIIPLIWNIAIIVKFNENIDKYNEKNTIV